MFGIKQSELCLFLSEGILSFTSSANVTSKVKLRMASKCSEDLAVEVKRLIGDSGLRKFW